MQAHSNFEAFNLETKIRAMVQDLIAPTIRRTMEVQSIAEKVQKNDDANTDRIQSLEYNVSRLISKLPMIDDLYKQVQQLNSEKNVADSMINLKNEGIMSQVNLNTQSVENLIVLNKANEETLINLKTTVIDYTESLTGLKDSLLQENAILSKKLEKTRNQAKELWDTLKEKMLKTKSKVKTFNDITIPKVQAEIEMFKRKIENEVSIMKNHIEMMISFEEFEKFGKSLKGEIEKTHQNFKILSENSEKVEEYLDHFLPLETWSMVSEGISSLDPKILTSFISLDSQKYDTLKLDVEFDYLDIEGLSKRALDAYEEGIKRSESISQMVAAAMKPQRKGFKKVTKNTKLMIRTDLINRGGDLRGGKKIEDVINEENETWEDREDKVLRGEGLKKKESSRRNSHLFVMKNKGNSRSDFEITGTEDEVWKMEQQSHYNDDDEQNYESFIDKRTEVENIRSPTSPFCGDSPKDPVREVSTLTVENLLAAPNLRQRRKAIIKIEDSSSLYFPVPSRPVSRAQNSILSKSQSSKSNFSQEIEKSSSVTSSPSIDANKLETDIENLKSTMSNLETLCNQISETTQQNSKNLTETLEKFSQDLTSNFSLMHGEIKGLIQKNKQSRTDVAKTLSNYYNDLKDKEKATERFSLQFYNISELVSSLVEFCKVLHTILTQEEEDRENLSLLGFSETNAKLIPKPYLSLKPECMSCSGSNTLVTSAFKMACINYNPSPVKYNLRSFSRKQIIQTLGTFLSESWRTASAKPPYDIIPPATMSNISEKNAIDIVEVNI
ncbi:hypothetical protein SteCoe_36034 [Stentor coeruleus]|uniref:Uncharacterized protein n=1 Tax=Stentor coeruleus TaxID=5963 RepID=A0A1R2AR25_9CILI|nr:hypothetical protein SteCoe_36034 [Stentor coeruleus]